MKLSYNALKDFVDLSGISPEEIGEKLTLHSCEVEEVFSLKERFETIVTGKILEIEPHKNSEKLMKAQVDTGKKGERQILFGETLEVSVGDIVPVALPGTKLPSGIEIAEREMAGELSQGMICINSELGYKNENLTIFPPQTTLGVPLYQVCPEYGDVILDIDNKSITHRPDMWGHRGFARELSAIFQRKRSMTAPSAFKTSAKETYPVQIQTPACRRFCAVKMSGICVQPSDLTTQVRLENLGIRAISHLVDITNRVLVEFGQPMHVFDADKVCGEICVRQARKGEELWALDGETYKLDPLDIVIADEEKVLSIAGIMGGMESGVTAQTQNIIFEAAHFEGASIRRTSARLGLRSESSMRFEKSLDPENTIPAIHFAVQKVLQASPSSKVETLMTDIYPRPYKKLVLSLHPDKVRALSGMDLSDQEIIRLLESVDFDILSQKYCLEVEVPSFRATKDIEMEEDLIEEIVRLYGLDKIPSHIPHLPIVPPRSHPLREMEWKIRDFLSARGMMEVMHYSLVGEKDKQLTEKTDYVSLQNPLSSEQSLMRVTLLSGFLKSLESELRTHKDVHYFEIGKTYHPQKGETLPREDLCLGILWGQISADENELFYHLKTELERLFTSFSCTVSFEFSDKKNPLAHPSKGALIYGDKENFLGELYILHPRKNDIAHSSIVFAEIHLKNLLENIPSEKIYRHLSTFPAFYRDISLLLPKKTPIKEVEKSFYQSADFLDSVELFDEFFDDQKFGSDKKNLAFHLKFQSPKKTLLEEEVERDFQKIVKRVGKDFSGELRL